MWLASTLHIPMIFWSYTSYIANLNCSWILLVSSQLHFLSCYWDYLFSHGSAEQSFGDRYSYCKISLHNHQAIGSEVGQCIAQPLTEEWSNLTWVWQVDWNRVASDVEVSNGHAARMRYSRFRQQMEGTTGANKPKRKSKKAKTMEPPPPEMQGLFPMAPPLMMPTIESIDSSLSGNPFVKCEPGTEGNSNLQSLMQHSPQFMSETSTEGQYYFPQDFTSMQFQLASSIPSRISSPSQTSSFMNPYQFSTASAGYPYSSASTQSSFDLREFDQLPSFTNYAPTISWEPRPPSHQEGHTVKVEEEQQTEEGIPSTGSQEDQPAVIKVENIQDWLGYVGDWKGVIHMFIS